MAGLVDCGLGSCLLMRRENRVQHARDGAPFGLGWRSDLFELLLLLRRRPTLAGGAPGRRADQLFDGDPQHPGDGGQHGDRDAGGAALVMGHGLLGDAQFLGQVGLREAERLASLGDRRPSFR